MNPFPNTRWSLVLRAKGDTDGEPERPRAVQELCAAYWPPLYGFLRRHGLPPEEAEDTLQGFLAEFLDHRGFERADQSRGRLRSYLLASLRHHLSHQRARDAAAKRGRDRTIGIEPGAIEALEADVAARSELDPEQAYLCLWARRVLDASIERLRHDYARRGQLHVFEALEPLLVNRPAAGDFSLVRQTLTMSKNATVVALHRLRRRFGEHLRSEVAHTLDAGGDVEAELRALANALSAL